MAGLWRRLGPARAFNQCGRRDNLLEKMRWSFCVLTLLALALGTARAQPTAQDQNAAQIDAVGAGHYKAAVRFLSDGKYEAARVEFQAAYDLTGHADLLHNLSMVAEKQERWQDAIRLEEQFLSAPTLALSQRERDEANGRLARLREQAAANAETLKPAVSSAEPAAPKKPRPARIVGIVGAAVSGVLLLSALGTGGAALHLKADLESRPISRAELDDGLSQGHTLQSTTIALGVVGGVLAIGSISLLAATREKRR